MEKISGKKCPKYKIFFIYENYPLGLKYLNKGKIFQYCHHKCLPKMVQNFSTYTGAYTVYCLKVITLFVNTICFQLSNARVHARKGWCVTCTACSIVVADVCRSNNT